MLVVKTAEHVTFIIRQLCARVDADIVRIVHLTTGASNVICVLPVRWIQENTVQVVEPVLLKLLNV